MTTTRQRARIDARLSRAHKAFLKLAAGLSGQPISRFLVVSALERAQRIIDEHTETQLSAVAAQRFLALIEGARPNAVLRRAAMRYRQRYG